MARRKTSQDGAKRTGTRKHTHVKCSTAKRAATTRRATTRKTTSVSISLGPTSFSYKSSG